MPWVTCHLCVHISCHRCQPPSLLLLPLPHLPTPVVSMCPRTTQVVSQSQREGGAGVWQMPQLACAQSSTVAVPCPTGTPTSHHPFPGPRGSCLRATSKTRLSRRGSPHAHPCHFWESRPASHLTECILQKQRSLYSTIKPNKCAVLCKKRESCPALPTATPAPSELPPTSLSEVLDPNTPEHPQRTAKPSVSQPCGLALQGSLDTLDIESSKPDRKVHHTF